MNFLHEQQGKMNQNLEKVHAQSRLEDRALLEKILSVILGVLGFSLTLFSTEFLSQKIFVSCSKYFLLFSWIFYCVSLIIGLFYLKKETSFQKRGALQNTLFALDNLELMDSNLKVKEGKNDQYIALMVLHNKRLGDDDWSAKAKEIFEKNKIELNSYKMVSNPDEFYSLKDRRLISRLETIFYSLLFLATISFMFSVFFLIL